ncbi:MAG: hypothetical protein J7L47_08535 [Candidatus Odinarchaeota archaeon]|nr:hypothetical protein [Candidatus Odinarchaeota archaeon]
MNEKIMGIDVGTTGCKTTIFDLSGNLISSAYTEYPLYTSPDKGYAEQNPEDWWTAVKKTMTLALLRGNISPSEIIGIGITGQSTSIILLNSTGRPIRPSILYLDSRGEKYIPQLSELVGPLNFVEVKVYTNLQWLRENEENTFKKIDKVLDVKEFIAYKLTNEVTFDSFAIAPERVKQLNEKFGIPDSFFGAFHTYDKPVGKVSQDVAKEVLVPEGVNVVVGPWDGMCNVIGSGIIEDGVLMDVAGTTEIIAMTTKEKTALSTHKHLIGDRWLIYTSTPLAISYTWFKNILTSFSGSLPEAIDPYSILNTLAMEAPPGSDGLIFVPTIQGDFMKPNLRGAYIGIGSNHTVKHMTRAILEGVAYHLKMTVDSIEGEGVPVKTIRVSGGGAKSRLWNQIKADVLEKPVEVQAVVETGGLGVAMLTAVALEKYKSLLDATNSMVHIKETITPNKENSKIYRKYYQRFVKHYEYLESQ